MTVRQRRPRKHALRGPKLFQRSVESGTLRLRVLLILGGLLAIAQTLNIQISSDSWAENLISAGMLGNLVAFTLAVWLALQISSLFHANILGYENLKSSRSNLIRKILGTRIPVVDLSLESLTENNSTVDVLNIGGPALLRIAMDSAAVLEGANGQFRVLGPSEKAQILEPFEKVNSIIDLRDQIADLNFSARSSDGIRIQVNGGRIVYSVTRGKEEASLARPYPFSKQAVMRLIRLAQNAGKDSRGNPEMKSLIALQGKDFFARELQQFISQIQISDLIDPQNNGSSQSSSDQSLLLAREQVRDRFERGIRSAAIERGFELHWIDIGTWKSDELAREILHDFQQESLDNIPYSLEEVVEERRSEELNRLFSELFPAEIGEDREADPKKTQTKLIASYLGLLEGLNFHYGDLLFENDQSLDTLLRFLRVLSKRAGKSEQNNNG